MSVFSQWIWHRNEFEHFLHKKLMLRRRERRVSPVLPSWRIDGAYDFIIFNCEGKNDRDIRLVVTARGRAAIKIDNAPVFIENPDEPIPLSAGKHSIRIELYNPQGLPCIYVEGEGYESGTKWTTNCGNVMSLPAATGGFFDKSVCPEDYRLPVRRLDAVKTENVKEGTLYDFGREVLGFPCLKSNADIVELYYGESRTEALAVTECEVYDVFTLSKNREFIAEESRAFRYVYVKKTDAVASLYCLEEYYPKKNRAYFKSDDELLNKIYDDSLYTLAMTSREFFIDGVKRDRWVWSGDAYQSALMNYYTYFDKEIVKRTIIALLGKGEVDHYVNTIMDYTFYLIIASYDYYRFSGDKDFIGEIYERLAEHLNFCLNRRNKNGFMQKLHEHDWVFVDWAEIDNSGEICFEQLLLYRSLTAMAEFAKLLHRDVSDRYTTLIDDLKTKLDVFWDERSGCFAHNSVKNSLTRYGNIFAVLFGIAPEKHGAIRRAFANKTGQKIVTPFMKFFETSAIAELGNVSEMLEYIKSYWGGMLNEGTGTFWEQYDSDVVGDKKYEMYGRPFGKSLCHSWGAGPLYLIGRYLVGLRPASPGYETFELKPHLGTVAFEAELPANEGSVYVGYGAGKLTVRASGTSGTLSYGGQVIEIKDGVEFVATFESGKTA